jgi:hypothetical protein
MDQRVAAGRAQRATREPKQLRSPELQKKRVADSEFPMTSTNVVWNPNDLHSMCQPQYTYWNMYRETKLKEKFHK